MSNVLILTLAETSHGQDGPYGQFRAFYDREQVEHPIPPKTSKGQEFSSGQLQP